MGSDTARNEERFNREREIAKNKAGRSAKASGGSTGQTEAGMNALTDVIMRHPFFTGMSPEHLKNFGYELMKRVAQVVIHRLQATRKQFLELQIGSALKS